MNKPFVVAVSQRVDIWAERGELRDALDQRLCQWLVVAGCVPIPVPNTLNPPSLVASDKTSRGLQTWLLAVHPDAVLLSGGNDIGEVPERDYTENCLLAYAKDNDLPVLGICRGMQMIAVWAGGKLVPLAGHVRTRHCLQIVEGSSEWPKEVNSFHSFALADCPAGFVVTACSEDGAIEAIRHESLYWEGWMWHPERETSFNPSDVERLKRVFGLL